MRSAASLLVAALLAGAVGSAYPLPASSRTTYGPTPGSFMLFVRAKLS